MLIINYGFEEALAPDVPLSRSVRRMRERIQESQGLAVARREDSSLGTIEALLENKKATPDQIINALSTQKVCGWVWCTSVEENGVCVYVWRGGG